MRRVEGDPGEIRLIPDPVHLANDLVVAGQKTKVRRENDRVAEEGLVQVLGARSSFRRAQG